MLKNTDSQYVIEGGAAVSFSGEISFNDFQGNNIDCIFLFFINQTDKTKKDV